MIRISLVGTTRLVVIVGPWAMKFARGERGRRCNRYESDLYTSVDERRRAMLCPVRWCSRGGQLSVMASARPLHRTEQEALLDCDGFPDWDYMPGEESEPFEYKASDWGWFRGRLVALDYSTPAHDTKEELAQMMRAALGE
jgi:hypothetical protein